MSDHRFGSPIDTIPHDARLDEWQLERPDYRALAECRHCNRRVVVEAQVEDGDLMATSTGARPGCQNPRCGDLMPDLVFCWWRVAPF